MEAVAASMAAVAAVSVAAAIRAEARRPSAVLPAEWGEGLVHRLLPPDQRLLRPGPIPAEHVPAEHDPVELASSPVRDPVAECRLGLVPGVVARASSLAVDRGEACNQEIALRPSPEPDRAPQDGPVPALAREKELGSGLELAPTRARGPRRSPVWPIVLGHRNSPTHSPA